MSYLLLTPGPVPVPDEVRAALAQPVIHHRTPEFEAILARVLARLPKVFVSEQPAYILTSTGSGAMEAAVVNFFSSKDTVLCICAGKFGERWAEMCEIYGLNTIRLNVPWGKDLDLREIERQLKLHPEIQAIFCQACETSTGAWLPVNDLAALTRHTDRLLLVDAITALGVTHLPMDEWGLDVVIGGSQKAFMLPTGLSFISCSARARARLGSAKLPRYYFDLRREIEANRKNQTFFSSPVSMITALDQTLAIFAERGLGWFQKRAQRLALATRAGLGVYGFEVFASTPSPSLSCLAAPAGINTSHLREALEKKHQITIMSGQDQLASKVIRVGHMGAIDDEDLLALIEAVGVELDQASQIRLARQQAEQFLGQGS